MKWAVAGNSLFGLAKPDDSIRGPWAGLIQAPVQNRDLAVCYQPCGGSGYLPAHNTPKD